MTAAAKPDASHPALSAVQAIAAVMRELPSIGKDETAPGSMGGYKYRGIEAITRHLQPLMAAHGLIIAPQVTSYEVVAAPGQKEAWQDTYLTVRWLIYGPDGSHVEAQTQGIGRDHTDKGSTKAQTQAFKYLLMALFCIADGKDDGDGADLSGSERENGQTHSTIDVRDAITMYAKLLEIRGTPAADAVKALAEREGHALTEVGLRDREWRERIGLELDYLANTELASDTLPLDEVPT